MKLLLPPNKSGKKSNPFYNLSIDDRVKVMEGTIKELEKSPTSKESRDKELRLLRGEY